MPVVQLHRCQAPKRRSLVPREQTDRAVLAAFLPYRRAHPDTVCVSVPSHLQGQIATCGSDGCGQSAGSHSSHSCTQIGPRRPAVPLGQGHPQRPLEVIVGQSLFYLVLSPWLQQPTELVSIGPAVLSSGFLLPSRSQQLLSWDREQTTTRTWPRCPHSLHSRRKLSLHCRRQPLTKLTESPGPRTHA